MNFSRTKTSKDKRKETSGNMLRQIMYGQVVSGDFFARNWIVIVLAMFLILIYIAGKYTCMTKMEEVRRLSSELEVVKAERVRVQSEYMSNIRESSMQVMVDSLHSGLKVQDMPPYIIKLSEEK